MAKWSGSRPDYSRLCSAIHKARLSLKVYRENRRHAVRQYVGPHWSEEGTGEEVPVNLLSLYVSIFSSKLVAKNPRVMLSTFDRELKPIVTAMESWANKEIERSQLVETYQRIIVDALFSIGIAKVALASPAEAAYTAWGLSSGQPFIDRVDLDDFVFDIHCRSFKEMGYIGHRYRVPLDVVKDSKLYGKARKRLEPTPDAFYNAEGDERISLMGRGVYSTEEEYEDFVDLWEIYLPRHRVILTLADADLAGPTTGEEGEPLREQNWVGPATGPYYILSYGVVPGNAMPKAPIQDLLGLHEGVNRSYRKVQRQIDRLKENTFVQSGSVEDGERLQQASDGDIFQVNHPEHIKTVITGGQAVQLVLTQATAFKELFSWAAGNLDIAGGLSPQSKTAHQDEMLNQNSSQTIADKQDKTTAFVGRTLKGLCWYWWHDPFLVQRSRHSIPGAPGVEINRMVTPQQRQRGRFEDLEIEVDPYSMQPQTPQSRMQALDQLMTQILVPMAPILQQQGIVTDFNNYLRMKAKYMDMPDLPDLTTVQPPPVQDGVATQGGAELGAGPANTTRRYVRENMPGRTEQGNNMNLMNALQGVNPGGAPETSGKLPGMGGGK